MYKIDRLECADGHLDLDDAIRRTGRWIVCLGVTASFFRGMNNRTGLCSYFDRWFWRNWPEEKLFNFECWCVHPFGAKLCHPLEKGKTIRQQANFFLQTTSTLISIDSVWFSSIFKSFKARKREIFWIWQKNEKREKMCWRCLHFSSLILSLIFRLFWMFWSVKKGKCFEFDKKWETRKNVLTVPSFFCLWFFSDSKRLFFYVWIHSKVG